MMEQLPPRPSVAGFAQRLWDNMYNPQARQTREFGNSLKSDVHHQLRQGQSLRSLLKIVENVLEGTVDTLPRTPVLPAAGTVTPVDTQYKRSAARTQHVPKKARTSLVAPFIEPMAPEAKVKTVALGESEVELLGQQKRTSRRSAAKENFVQYMRRFFGKSREKSTVEVIKKRRQSPLVSTMASLLY